MPRRRKKRRRKNRSRWWTSLDSGRRSQILHGFAWLSVLAILVYSARFALAKIESHVDGLLVERSSATLVFEGLPEDLARLAEADLRDSVADLLDRQWTDDRLCRGMAERLSGVSWVERVNHVRRTGDARFEASCVYRMPFAMVQHGGTFHLVDRNAVRLAGTYQYNSSWQSIQGVADPPIEPGNKWGGDDLLAGLEVAAALESESFARQITAVLVGNYAGRSNTRSSHLELATDRAGGRIRWGSAPGSEIEENGLEQKLAILRDNYRRTGRVDANHSIIDISTFPDRFIVPG